MALIMIQMDPFGVGTLCVRKGNWVTHNFIPFLIKDYSQQVAVPFSSPSPLGCQ